MLPLPDKASVLLYFGEASATGSQPLRVGVVHDGARPSRWVESLVAFLTEFPGIQVFPCALGDETPAESELPSQLMDRLYSKSRQQFDPFRPAAKSLPRTVSIQSGSADNLRNLGCGIVIWLATRHQLTLDLAGLGKHG